MLGSEVEDLDGAALRLEGNNVLAPVHDGTVSVDGAPEDLIVVLKVDNDNLRLVVFVELLADTDIVIGF